MNTFNLQFRPATGDFQKQQHTYTCKSTQIDTYSNFLLSLIPYRRPRHLIIIITLLWENSFSLRKEQDKKEEFFLRLIFFWTDTMQ